jgi:dihydroorotate dehydrogenase electron transfer subunit
MKDLEARVVANDPLSDSFWQLSVEAEGLPIARPGQFVQLRCRDARATAPFLRRPFSVLRQRGARLELLYKVIGPGTRYLAALRPGDGLGVLGPLGRGFADDYSPGDELLVVAGGTGLGGVAALIEAAAAAGARCTLYYGVRRQVELPEARLAELPARIEVVVEEQRGYVTTALAEHSVSSATRAALCGPTPMMKAAAALLRGRVARLELSLEEMMGCGFGICYTCPVPRRGQEGYASACVEGPVFDDREVALR